MRTLTETEMNVAAGGVMPIPEPIPGPRPTMPEPDPHWVHFILFELYPPWIPNMDP